MDIKTVHVDEVPYLYIDGSAPMDPAEVGKLMEQCYGKLMGFMQQHAIAPQGQPIAVYYGYDPDTLAFRAGIPVSRGDMEKAEGEIKADVTPSGEVIHILHTGPYSDLGATYMAAQDALKKDGKGMGAPTWEVYVDDPGSTPEAELRTEIYSVPGKPY